MEVYMKNQFFYLGILTSQCSKLENPFIIQWKKEEVEDIFLLILKLHKPKECEFMYTAQRFFLASLEKLSYQDLIKVTALPEINSFWDNTDSYSLTFKRFLKNFPQYIEKFTAGYSLNKNLWVTRLSIICQLGLKEKTNEKNHETNYFK